MAQIVTPSAPKEEGLAVSASSWLSKYPAGSVIDIGGSNMPTRLKHLLQTKLFAQSGNQLRKNDGQLQRLLPSVLLSDDGGLDLWRGVTRMPNYYGTRDEIEIFEKYGADIGNHLPEGATLIDLGSGDIRKIKPFLDVLESRKQPFQYLALDVSKKSLENCMHEIAHRYRWVRCLGLWGSFHHDLDWFYQISGPRWFLSLGSIFGNDWFEPAVASLKMFSSNMAPDDRMLLGMDSCKNQEVLWNSYHDDEGVFESFIRNGLDHTNKVMGYDWYSAEDWSVEGRLIEKPCMHVFAIIAKKDIICTPLNVKMDKGTQIDCYEAFKYSPEEMSLQFEASGFQQLAVWHASSTRIIQYLVAASGQDQSVQPKV